MKSKKLLAAVCICLTAAFFAFFKSNTSVVEIPAEVKHISNTLKVIATQPQFEEAIPIHESNAPRESAAEESEPRIAKQE